MNQRDPDAYVTTLSADIGLSGVSTDNCYHVIYAREVSNLLIDGFYITGGQADGVAGSSQERGGGLYLYGGTNVSVMSCVVTGNYAALYGGGVYYGQASRGVITHNYAGTYGGGVYYSMVSNCVIAHNSAGDYGGGAYKAYVLDCLLYSNSALYGGGSIWSTNINSTITHNAAATSGGGTYAGVIENSIVWGNNSPVWSNQSSPVIVNYSCTAPLASGTSNLSADPLFVMPEQADFRLLPHSPCTNAGNNSYTTATNDLAGNTRIWDGTVDMGAYEAIYFDVTAHSGPYGTIAPTGTQQVYMHADATFTNQPDSYYHVDAISINGIPNETNLVFVSTNVQEAQTVIVSFAENVVTGLPASVTERWLAQYGWTNQFYDAAQADQDVDNMLTWQEYVAGTVPTSSASFFQLMARPDNGSTNVVLQWTPCMTGRTYWVWSTTDLMQPFTNTVTLSYPVNAYTVQVNDVMHSRIEVGW